MRSDIPWFCRLRDGCRNIREYVLDHARKILLQNSHIPRNTEETLSLILITIILFLAVVLRCVNIQNRGIYYDDAFSIFLAREPLDLIIMGTAADTMPPLYYFLLHFWMGLGDQLWILRLLNVILSVGGVFMAFVLFNDLFGRRVGLWTALIVAISPIQIYHAQELRMYALLVFGQLGFIWFFFQILNTKDVSVQSLLWRRSVGCVHPTQIPLPVEQVTKDHSVNSIRNWLGVILLGAISMYSHNLAAFIFPVPVLILICKRRWKLLANYFAALLIIGCLSLPWLVIVPQQIEKIQTAFWTPRPGIVEILQAIVLFTATLPLPGIWQSIAILLSIEVLVLVAISVRKTFSRLDSARQESIIWILMFLIIPPALMFLGSYLMRPIFVPRGFLISSLMYYGLSGLVIGLERGHMPGKLIAVGFVLSAVISLPYQYSYDQFPRSPYFDAMEYIKENAIPNTKIIHDNKLSYFPSKYYAPELPQSFLGDEPGSHNDTLAFASQVAMKIFPEQSLSEAVNESEHIYFIVFSRAIEEYNEIEESGHPNINFLKERYHFVNKYVFEDLEVYSYDK